MEPNTSNQCATTSPQEGVVDAGGPMQEGTNPVTDFQLPERRITRCMECAQATPTHLYCHKRYDTISDVWHITEAWALCRQCALTYALKHGTPHKLCCRTTDVYVMHDVVRLSKEFSKDAAFNWGYLPHKERALAQLATDCGLANGDLSDNARFSEATPLPFAVCSHNRTQCHILLWHDADCPWKGCEQCSRDAMQIWLHWDRYDFDRFCLMCSPCSNYFARTAPDNRRQWFHYPLTPECAEYLQHTAPPVIDGVLHALGFRATAIQNVEDIALRVIAGY